MEEEKDNLKGLAGIVGMASVLRTGGDSSISVIDWSAQRQLTTPYLGNHQSGLGNFNYQPPEPTLGEIMAEIEQIEERLMELKQIAINKMDKPEEKIERRKLLK